MDYRPVLFITGIFIAITALLMLFPMAADFFAGHPDWRAFAAAALVAGSVGTGLAFACAQKIESLSTKQSFLLVTLAWLSVAMVGALPFMLGSRGLSLTDAFFESMSGLTTTGSTVVANLDTSPPGFLLWRSMLQWLGGIGVVIMATALLPFLAVGGLQLFRLEASGPAEKILPGAGQFASVVTIIYVSLTAFCFIAYWASGMSSFDAINHAMTTISTGGFSTHDASFGYFLTDPNIRYPVDVICTFFMIVGALPFSIYVLMLNGQIGPLFKDQEVRLFVSTLAIVTCILMFVLMTEFDAGPFHAFRLAAFNLTSLMTGAGYASADYGLWGPFAVAIVFIIPFVGGCSGSTSCGLKVFRLQVAFSALSLHVRRLAHPHRVTVARHNGRVITGDVFLSVLSFFFMYFAVFATSAVVISNFDQDALTSLSAAATSLANVGPGLGPIVGPSGNFATMPDGVKWTMAVTMLVGRLEVLTVLVLLTPGFWKR